MNHFKTIAASPFRTLILISMLLIAHYPLLMAGGGDDHTHGPEKPLVGMVGLGYFSTETVTDKYEVLLRYEPMLKNEKSALTLFLSEYATNKPVDSADIRITAQEDPNIQFVIRQTNKGTYVIETEFPDNKIYSLAVNVTSKLGSDLLLLQNVEPGKELPKPEDVEKPSSKISLQMILMLAGALFIGLLAGILIQKRNTISGKRVISIMLLLISLSTAIAPSHAHGGEDHGDESGGSNFSSNFNVPKETQFLFDVVTHKMKSDSFTESILLAGTIIPSSRGQAVISTPQTGKIISLKASVGQQVRAGQLLAVVEQNIDAGTQISLATERNSLEAELEAARREYERLKTIQDIVAKKDIDEARARYQRAEANLKVLKSNSGRTISLTAPISGSLMNFNLSLGTTVNAGETLFTIIDLNKVYVEVQVQGKDETKLKQDAKFTIESNSNKDKKVDATLISLAKEIDPTNQTQRVLLEVNNPKGDFKIGEFVNVRVFGIGGSRALSVPNTAFTEINGKPVVFIKDAAEIYSVSYVTVGQNNGTSTSIDKGVEEGERVVINGSYQLKMISLNQ